MSLIDSFIDVDNASVTTNLSRFFFLILCSYSLGGCREFAEKETFKIGVVKDQFKYFNLTQFDADFNDPDEELIKVEDIELLDLLWHNLMGKDPTGRTFFYSYQDGLPGLQEFTILFTDERVQELHYLVLDSTNSYLSNLLVAQRYCSMDSQMVREISTTMTENADFTTMINENYPDTLTTGDRIRLSCMLSRQGKFTCGEGKFLTAISLWDDIALIDTVGESESGNFLASIAFGEKIYDLEEKLLVRLEDSLSLKEYEFSKVELEDGTKGWIPSRFFAFGAKAAAAVGTCYMYLKPHDRFKTRVRIDTMNLLGVYQESSTAEGWYRVKFKPDSLEWFKEGWVKGEYLTLDRSDVTVASLGSIALHGEDSMKVKRIISILEQPSLRESRFVPFLRHQLQKDGILYIQDLKNKFAFQDLKEFPDSFLGVIPELTMVEDSSHIQFLWKYVFKMMPGAFDAIFEAEKLKQAFYFYSWQTRDDLFIDFTILFNHQAADGSEVQELYYIILSQNGKFIAEKLIAGHSKLGVRLNNRRGTIKGNEIIIYDGYEPGSENKGTVQDCIIEKDGEIVCAAQQRIPSDGPSL